ncbi:lipopolysaccharide biosynthesis protein [Vagococcus fluvialis]|uniref:lipopolysaccharide biosynthesis protein n=1 Tax=Vagococcus fluvialis TaxID=2738 RepID=UPI003D0D2785
MNENLKKGLMYSALGKYSNVFIQLIINAVLSRILTPEDYGIVASVQVFILFFQMLIDAGMGPAIIQNKKLTEKDYDILFSFSIIFSILLALFFGFFGNFIALFYADNIFIKLTWAQCVFVFFTGISVVPTAVLNKNKQFKIVNFSNVIGNLIGGIIGILAAIKGLGVYSLIISTSISSVIYFIINKRNSKLEISFKLELSPLIEISFFAKNQLFFNIINYFSRNSDNILIGKFMGNEALGNYSKTYQVLMMPNSILLGVINPVLQPIMSDYENDVEYIKNLYLKIVHFLALIGIPLSVFLSLSSKQVIFFLFGNQWGDAVLPFCILSLSVWIQMTLSSSGTVYQSRNLTRLLLYNGIISSSILVISIIIGILFGSLFSVSFFLLLGFIINFFVSFNMIMKKALNSNLIILLKEFKKPLIPAFFVGIFLKGFEYLNISMINFFDLLFRGIIFLIVMVVYILFSDEKEFIKDLFLKK